MHLYTTNRLEAIDKSKAIDIVVAASRRLDVFGTNRIRLRSNALWEPTSIGSRVAGNAQAKEMQQQVRQTVRFGNALKSYDHVASLLLRYEDAHLVCSGSRRDAAIRRIRSGYFKFFWENQMN